MSVLTWNGNLKIRIGISINFILNLVFLQKAVHNKVQLFVSIIKGSTNARFFIVFSKIRVCFYLFDIAGS